MILREVLNYFVVCVSTLQPRLIHDTLSPLLCLFFRQTKASTTDVEDIQKLHENSDDLVVRVVGYRPLPTLVAARGYKIAKVKIYFYRATGYLRRWSR